MARYVATSRGGELAVTVDAVGWPMGVQLSPTVMEVPAAELASRIVRLHTLASLRGQLASRALTEAQVDTYAATIDF